MSTSESEGEAPPSSDVCDDYYQNLLTEWLRTVDQDDPGEATLDLLRALRVLDIKHKGHYPDWSLCESPSAMGGRQGIAQGGSDGEGAHAAEDAPFKDLGCRLASEGGVTESDIAPEVGEDRPTECAEQSDDTKLSPPSSAAPERETGIPMPSASAEKEETGVTSDLSPRAMSVTPSTAQIHPSRSDAAAVVVSQPPEQALPTALPLPAFEACPPEACPLAKRADWALVEAHTLFAYRHFKSNPEPSTTYTCPPMCGSKTRLAMHRAAEVLGCRSASNGKGRERRVVLTWTKDGVFPIGELSVILAVRVVLVELFIDCAKGRKGNATVKKARREARKARRKEERLEAATRVADKGMDAVVDEAVEEYWQKMSQPILMWYDGAKAPGQRKKGKEAKKKAKKKEKGKAKRQTMAGKMDEVPEQADPVRNGVPLPSGYGPGYPDAHPFFERCDPDTYQVVGGYAAHTALRGGEQRRRKASQAGPSARPLASSNRGFAMLEKMGWKQGEGLGTNKEGMTEPVEPHQRSKRSGLGVGRSQMGGCVKGLLANF